MFGTDSPSDRQALPRFPVLKSPLPKRRDGERHLADIPADIYLEIFQYFPIHHWPTRDENNTTLSRVRDGFKKTLSNLIAVCRLFRAILLPRRLHHLNVRPDKPNLDRLATETFSNPTEDNIFAFVRTISFNCWHDGEDEPSPQTKDTLRTIGGALPQFVNVQQLCLFDVPITRHFFGMVSYMDNLHIVSIRNSFFETPSEWDALLIRVTERTPVMPWTKFDLSQTCGYMEYLPWIVSLAASPALASLECTWYITEAILSHPCDFSSLETLRVLHCHDWDTLATILNSTPGVKSLGIVHQERPFPPPTDGRILQLAPGALPHLQILHCPSAIVGELVAGRPVHDVRIETSLASDPWDLSEEELAEPYVIGLLAHSAVPIRRLHINTLVFQQILFKDGRDDAVADRMQELKGLEELTLDLTEDLVSEADMLSVVIPSKKPINSYVRTVHIDLVQIVPVLRFEKEHELITQYFAPAYPRATQFTLTEHIEWHKYERCCVPTWTPHVRSAVDGDHLRLRVWIQAEERRRLGDWDGLLKGLFDEEELRLPRLRHTLGLDLEDG